MSLKLVLFDVGGTLIKYPTKLEDSANLFSNYQEELGLSAEILQGLVDNYLRERKTDMGTLREATFLGALTRTIEEHHLDMSGLDMMDMLEFLYKKTHADLASLIDGAKEVLSYVKDRGLSIGLISNTAWPGRFHEADLRRFGLFDYFDQRVWTSKEGIRKPHRALFYKVLGTFNVCSSEAVYIGDNFSRDVVGPNSVGVRSIWVSGEISPREFSGWQVKNLCGVKQVLSRIE